MATHGDYSPEARERADRTVLAAGVFAENADRIVLGLAGVPDGYVVVAVVNDAHEFTGTHHVDRGELVEHIPRLEEPNGWAMVFSAGTTAADIRRRSEELAETARRKGELIDRISARRAAD
jgi:hypothetical protein